MGGGGDCALVNSAAFSGQKRAEVTSSCTPPNVVAKNQSNLSPQRSSAHLTAELVPLAPSCLKNIFLQLSALPLVLLSLDIQLLHSST